MKLYKLAIIAAALVAALPVCAGKFQLVTVMDDSIISPPNLFLTTNDTVTASFVTNVVNAVVSDLTTGGLSAQAATNIVLGLALTNESDTLESVAARGGFAGTEFIDAPYEIKTAGTGPGYYISKNQVSGVSATGYTWGLYPGFMTMSEADGLQSELSLYSGGGTLVSVIDSITCTWSFRRAQGGYEAAALSDLSAHATNAAAHADKVSVTGGTAINLTIAGITTLTNGVTEWAGWWTNGAPTKVYNYLGTNYVESLY